MQLLVADDHAIVRRGLRRLLEVAGLTVVAEAADGLEAFHLCLQHHPDVVVLDIEMPKLNGFEVITRLRGLYNQPAVIVLSGHEDESHVVRAVEMGVRAYLVKSASDEDLVPAIYAVTAGRSFFSAGVVEVLLNAYVRRLRNQDATNEYRSLTEQEKRILRLLAEGRSPKEITAIVELSSDAVDTHCTRLMRKFDLARCPVFTSCGD
jgi:DNA-binding NarL/FixJ family response regulator